jgi:hypothetical protein
MKSQQQLLQQQQRVVQHCALPTTPLLSLSKHHQPLAVLALILHQKLALLLILQLKVCNHVSFYFSLLCIISLADKTRTSGNSL